MLRRFKSNSPRSYASLSIGIILTALIGCGGGGGGGGGGGNSSGGSSGGGGTGTIESPVLSGFAQPSGIRLNWYLNSPPVNPDFRLYRRGPDSGEWTLLASQASTQFTDTDTFTGKVYTYYVTSVEGLVESAPSNQVQVEAIYQTSTLIGEFARIEGPDDLFSGGAIVGPDNADGYYVYLPGTNTLTRRTLAHTVTSSYSISDPIAFVLLRSGKTAVLLDDGYRLLDEAGTPGGLGALQSWPDIGGGGPYYAVEGAETDPIIIFENFTAAMTEDGVLETPIPHTGKVRPYYSSDPISGDAAGPFAHLITSNAVRRWSPIYGGLGPSFPIPSAIDGGDFLGSIQLRDGRIALLGVEKRSPTFEGVCCYFFGLDNSFSGPHWVDDYGNEDSYPGRLRFLGQTDSRPSWRDPASGYFRDASLVRSAEGEAALVWKKRYINGSCDLVISELPTDQSGWLTRSRVPLLGRFDNHPIHACRAAAAAQNPGYIVWFGPYGSGQEAMQRWTVTSDGVAEASHLSGLPNCSYNQMGLGWITPNSALMVGRAGSSEWISGHYAIDVGLVGVNPGFAQRPIVDFSASPEGGGSPLMVQLTQLCSNNPFGWEWHLDDDSFVDATSPVTFWSFFETGFHHVTLVAENASGRSWRTRGNVAAVEAPSGYLDLIRVSPGSYVRGAAVLSCGNSASPPHDVTITYPFWLGKYEVTQSLYESLMGENPSTRVGANRPVENLTRNSAKEFCARLTAAESAAGQLPAGYEYRLPTEAEWEYCCRAGTTTEWYTGTSLQPGQENFGGSLADGETTPVGSFPANPWGFHDMHGNVREFCLDGDSNYSSEPQTNPLSRELYWRGILRGGSYAQPDICCTSAVRFDVWDPDQIYWGSPINGFRVALAPVANM